MESDEYELHEDETEHDYLGETDGDNGDGVELEDNLDGIGGMYDNFADDDLHADNSGELLGSIDFVNLSRVEVALISQMLTLHLTSTRHMQSTMVLAGDITGAKNVAK
ncbi:hypothetical protein S83_065990 [Arachis hypogaea]